MVTGLAAASRSAANTQGTFDLGHEGDMGGFALDDVLKVDSEASESVLPWI